MTLIEEPSVEPVGADRPRNRRRRRIATMAGLAVLLLIALVVWTATAAAARAQVVVLADQHALSCTPAAAATFTEVEAGSGAVVAVPAIRLDGPTRCRMRFVIANDGARTVRIESVRLGGMLPINGVRTGAVGGAGPVGTFDLAGGEATSVVLGFSWQRGCIARGGMNSDSDTPSVTVQADGLSGTIVKAGPSYAVLGTTATEAACPWRQ